MHTAEQLDTSQIESEFIGKMAGSPSFFEEWADLDRLGLIVTEPFGSLGASLLVQAAVATFYSVRPERTSEKPEYPEIYLFHLGGRWGDHSSFDFWPPRKEVFLLDTSPAELLGAINDRAITYLGFPSVSGADETVFEDGDSTWADIKSAEYRIRRGVEYSPSRRLANPNLILRSTDPKVLENSFSSVNLAKTLDTFERESDDSPKVLGPAVDDDFSRWLSLSRPRVDEVPETIRADKAAALEAAATDGLEEQYRVVPQQDLLKQLAGLPYSASA